MKRLLRAGLVAVVLAGAAAPAAAATTPPDPAPGGPQRPFEPDVAGPRNLDSLRVTATKGEGRSVTVAFDRRSRTAEGTVPAGARRFVFLFDRAISFNPEAFPTCARTVITEDGPDACPPGSQVGSGIGTSYDGTEQPVLVFNTRVGSLPGVLVVLPETDVILEQTFERVSTLTGAPTGGRWTRSCRPPPSRPRTAPAPHGSGSPSAPPPTVTAARSVSPRPPRVPAPRCGSACGASSSQARWSCPPPRPLSGKPHPAAVDAGHGDAVRVVRVCFRVT